MIVSKKNRQSAGLRPLLFIAILLVLFSFSPGLHADDWTQINRQPGGTFKAIAYGNSLFCAVGDAGLIWTSPTGTSWTTRTSPVSKNIYAICYGGGQFIAAGQTGFIMTSSNGSSWTVRKAVNSGDSFIAVAYNGTDMYVAAGDNGLLLTSPDGITWTTRNSSTGKMIWAMTYGNGKWVGSGASGLIIYSSDGINWTKATSGTSSNFYSAHYAGSKFLVGGQNGYCVSSTNGSTWSKVSTGTDNYFMSITHTGSDFVAVGNSDGYKCSMALISPNGSSWVRDKTPDYTTLIGVASGGGAVVAVGGRRLIIRNTYAGVGDGTGCATVTPPPAGDTITLTSPNGGESWYVGGTYNITWKGSKSYDTVDIEYFDGSQWNSVVTGTADDGSYAWTVPNAPIDNGARLWIKGWASDGNAVDYTDSNFSIIVGNMITILSPNGGESLNGGSILYIRWSTIGVFNTVDIEYTLDGGDTWSVIMNGTENDGVYAWTMPNVSTTNARIWIKGWGDAGNDTDYSDSYFTINSSSALVVSSPNGGENWDAGSTQKITWGTTGVVGNVNVEYSTNAGSTWTTIATSTNDGMHNWIVPNTLSDNCLVRVTEISGKKVSDTSNSVFSIIGDPELVVDKTAMNFGGIANTGAPNAQTLLISNGGGGTLDWSITSNMPWLSASPSSGNCDEAVSVSVNTNGLSAGTHVGTLTVTDANGATGSPHTVTVIFTVINSFQDQAPFGSMGSPDNGIIVGGSIAVTGWVLDDVETVSVKIYREVAGELSYIGDAVFVEGSRPDVEASYPDYPLSSRAGWGYMLLTNFLPDGPLVLKAIAKDTTGHEVILGTRTITVDNGNAVKPFGAIDSPAQGGDASGSPYRNNGWALTPPPNAIPTDGSTITVFIDGLPVGNATYNLYRSDIATLFPGYVNTNGAWGYFDIDTSALENGIHTIQWTVKDNGGRSDGIGSRYFNVANVGSGDCARKASNAASVTTETQVPRIKLKAGPSLNALRKSHHAIPMDYAEPVAIRTGYDESAPATIVYPDDNGNLSIEIKELQLLNLRLGDCCDSANRAYKGYMLVNGQLRRLPIGSSLLPNGTFAWEPGAGFVGEYKLVFFISENGSVQKKEVKITILPDSE